MFMSFLHGRIPFICSGTVICVPECSSQMCERNISENGSEHKSFGCSTTSVQHKRTGEDVTIQFQARRVNTVNSALSVTNQILSNDDSPLLTVIYQNSVNIYTSTCNGCTFTGNASTGDLSVRLENLQRSSGGTYKHSITEASGEVKGCVTVFILGVPEPVTIKADNNNVEGRNIKLTCSSKSTTNPQDPNLSLQYKWKVDNVDNPVDTRYTYSQSRHTLTINNLEKQDANKSFTCEATETGSGVTGLTSASSDVFRINVLYKPDSGPMIQSYTNNTVYYAIDNKQQTLTCAVTGGNPLASLSWSCFTGTEEDLSSGQTVSKRWTWGTSSSGTCTCSSTHLLVTENVVLNVRILSPPSTPVFLLHSQTVQGSTTVKIIRDSTAPITCSATSSPSPDRYTWTYDGQSTALSQIASLNPSQLTADGRYWCQVGNTMRPTQGQVENGSSSAYINIQRLFPPTKPVLKYGDGSGTTLPGSFKVVKEDNFNMHCSSTGNPSPSYLWTGDGRNTQNQIIAVSAITLDRVYTCKATNTMNPTFLSSVPGSSSTTVSVSVLSPPTNPSTTYHDSQSGSTSVTTSLKVIKGKSFSVECAATAVPAPTLSWKGPKISNSGTLMFTSIQERNDGTYNCTARNIMDKTFGSQEVGISATSLQIQVLYAPSVNPFNVEPIIEGSTLSVECKTVLGNPANITYTWKRKLSSSSDNTWRDIPGATVNGVRLLKTNINRSDAGTYRCTASNVMEPTVEQQQIGSDSKTFLLTVLYKTLISSFIEVSHPATQEVTVSENSTIDLQCKVDSNPGSTISILKDDKVEESEKNAQQISYTRSKASCDTAGIYRCTGYNEHNTEESKPSKDLRLFVTCSPRLQSPDDFMSNITSALDTEARLKITVVAYPVPKESEFIWSKRTGDTWETVTNDDNVKINTSGLDSSLIFLSVKVPDYQQYRVNITNDFGQFQQEFFLNPYGKPNPPGNVNVMEGSLKETSAIITWKPGFDGGPKQTFVIQYKIQGDSNWLTVTKEDEGAMSMNVSLTGLVEGTTYVYQMFSKNSEGNSSFTDTLSFTTIEKTTKRSNAALIGGAVGGSLLFIILVAVIVVVFVRRSSFKKGKSKASSEKNDRQPVYEDDNDYGMQDNPMYVSAGPRQSNSKAEGSSYGGAAAEYSTVNKTAKAVNIANDNEYAVVNKTDKSKAQQGKKKEKKKEGFFKDKKGKKVAQEGDIYENAPTNDFKAVAGKNETIYENPESSLSTQKKTVNKEGLIYADLTFNDQPKGQKKLVIHGLDSMTEYVEVDFTKKADPLPDSDDENIPPKI